MLTWILTAALASPLPLDTAGCDQIRELKSLSFTFNVDKDGKQVASRSWTWEPKTEAVIRTVDGEALRFTRGAPKDDAEKQADAGFTNDWFWLMPQCHVTRSADAQLAVEEAQPLPMGEGKARKVVVTYKPDGGGYTPGDAYDLFLDEAGKIAVWNFRKGNQPEPSMTTSFTDYAPLGPVQVATEHVSPDGNFRLYFTGLAAE